MAVILTFNAGSSSIKFAVFDATGARQTSGELQGIETQPVLVAKDGRGKTLADRRWTLEAGMDPHLAAIKAMMAWLDEHVGLAHLQAVGHRVVHGGPDFARPLLVTDTVLERLEALTPFAPLHQPACLGPIKALRTAYPDLPQIACFDTAFHRTLPPVARRLAVPRDYGARGVRRYGFHGLSYEQIARRLSRDAPDLARGRVLVAHVGNGASLCAMRAGASIGTTMGFSVLDGLVMGTRCGTLDPGVLLYMMREEKLSPERIEAILYHESGLRGVSGVSSDMRELRRQSDDPAVREALDLYVRRFQEQAGAMIATLQGIDGLVFTGGIGEHDAEFRRDVCAGLGWLGVILDVAANASHRPVISAPESAVAVRVIPADEEASIHRHALACLATRQAEERDDER
ncbi:acetate/propionate family kinase [Tanticharoenia sakaeratensis]|uniref:Acetate kinase n=1 Tax=Tanticharoenia sakaeratensis NBRC 103193 TaxID=1231623 RepID=A0A0D6MN59_9PROT|nr:acetate/propionate family kinase [Tanticharoenia sakaeratensis]GAN54871.1 acetate kinase [Tanticharoenia sakaeratensis NBRC 103193]GBQ22434.1 acetate kinase [Tanticharoenia sakaeratensis NBRC 103193]